jgi:HSP20 family protein
MIMSIVRYDPFREIRNLQDEVNRLFLASAGHNSGREDMMNGAWIPKVDIFENKESLVLEADLPGMSCDDFELSFENNVLTLRGERKFENKTDKDSYHRIERSYGSFTRSFTLPQTVTAEGAKAEFENGMLLVTLPRREETRARKIEVAGTDSKSKTIESRESSMQAGA